MAETQLPEVYRQHLDAGMVNRVLDDILHAAELLAVRVKRTGQRRADGTAGDLAGARAALLEQTIAGLQIRYRHRGRVWLDTVIPRGPDRFELVRVPQDQGIPVGMG